MDEYRSNLIIRAMPSRCNRAAENRPFCCRLTENRRRPGRRRRGVSDTEELQQIVEVGEYRFVTRAEDLMLCVFICFDGAVGQTRGERQLRRAGDGGILSRKRHQDRGADFFRRSFFHQHFTDAQGLVCPAVGGAGRVEFRRRLLDGFVFVEALAAGLGALASFQ